MALSSDEIIKREIIETIGTEINGLELRIYPESSNDDQKPFDEKDGLTFGINNVLYGSCDACWIKKEKWTNPFNNRKLNIKPVVALEGTDALNRGSSGNAQLQRFHHALGAVKAGLIGVYYLRKGELKIYPDLYGMAYYASQIEKGTYLIIDDLKELKHLLSIINNEQKVKKFLDEKLNQMYQIFTEAFFKKYKSWEDFAKKRSTIIKDNYVIKYASRMRRNWTDSSQRAGHIALGEMYLTKYFFNDKFVFYLFPRMTKDDIEYLDEHKKKDKEWYLLRNEKNVKILTIDDLENVPSQVRDSFMSIKNEPLKGNAQKIFKENINILRTGLENNTIHIKEELINAISKI